MGSIAKTCRILSMTVDLPVPRPPINTFKLPLKCNLVPSRNPPSQAIAMNSACGSGAGSLFMRIRESGSRKACRSPSIDKDDILMKQLDRASVNASGRFTSDALITATGRSRLCWASLFSRMARTFCGAAPIGQRKRKEVRIFPGAQARLPSERSKKAVIGGDMGCDGDSALAVNAIEKLQAILGAIGRQAAVIVNAEFADEPLQAVIFLRVIKAQEVDAVFGCGLESAKDKDASFPCQTDQAP